MRAVVAACVAARENLTEVGWYRSPDQPFDKATGQGIAYNSYAYATQIADLEVDVRTGEISVRNVYCAHDVGRAINPNMVEGQIEGMDLAVNLGFTHPSRNELGVLRTEVKNQNLL